MTATPLGATCTEVTSVAPRVTVTVACVAVVFETATAKWNSSWTVFAVTVG
jgi:hypothetical protein